MVLVAVLAVNWAVMRNATAVSQRVRRLDLSLCYSWVPDRGHLPKGEPVYADYVSVLESDRISAGLGLLAVGITPMVSLLGLGCVILLRNLAVRGRCSPFLLGLVASGSAVLFCFIGCCILATERVDRYAAAATDLVLYLPAQVIGGMVSDEIGQAIYCTAGVLVLVLPQVLLALLGGRLNEKKFRVTLMVMPRIETDSETAIVGDPE
jgi:hypothetical protein